MIDPAGGARVVGTTPRIACIFEPLQGRARSIAYVEAAARRAHMPFAVPPDIASHLVTGVETAAFDEALGKAKRHRCVISPRAGS
jgi:hypothetical protein